MLDEKKPELVAETKMYAVPEPVFLALRQVLGQLPHDQVGKLCAAIDQCKPT